MMGPAGWRGLFLGCCCVFVMLSATGCAFSGTLNPNAGQAHLWVLEGTPLPGREPLPASGLSLPESGELRILPRWLAVSAASHGEPQATTGHRSYSRLQFLFRVIRRDGSVMQWIPIAHRHAPLGEGGHQLDSTIHVRGGLIGLEPAKLGPIQVSQVAAIEVLANFLPPPEGNPLLYRGAAAIVRAPEVLKPGLQTDINLFHSGGTEAQKGYLIIAARIPVHGQQSNSYERLVQRLLLVSSEHHAVDELTEEGRRLFTALTSDTSISGDDLIGELNRGTYVLVVDLKVDIPQHEH
jgi:hypothetical protein